MPKIIVLRWYCYYLGGGIYSHCVCPGGPELPWLLFGVARSSHSVPLPLRVFSGSIPEFLGQLSNLMRLYLGHNQLSGEFTVWNEFNVLYNFSAEKINLRHHVPAIELAMQGLLGKLLRIPTWRTRSLKTLLRVIHDLFLELRRIFLQELRKTACCYHHVSRPLHVTPDTQLRRSY